MKDTLQRHKDKIRRWLEPRFGLLDDLITDGVLSHEEVAEITSKDTVFKQNDHLIKFLENKPADDYANFLLALTNSMQQHVVNYLQNPGNNIFV